MYLRQLEVSEYSSLFFKQTNKKENPTAENALKNRKRLHWIIFTFLREKSDLSFGNVWSVLGRVKSCPKAISLSFVDVSSLCNYKQATFFKT